MLHTDGNNPSQPLHLTSLTLVEKEAPEWGCGACWATPERTKWGAGGLDKGGGRNQHCRGVERGVERGMAERKGAQGGEASFFFFLTKCLLESCPVLSSL